MASVRLDGLLGEFVPRRNVTVPAETVGGALDRLEREYPRLAGKVRDETGRLRRFVKVFVNGSDVAGLRGLATPLAAEDRVEILHSIQGG
ncbi:MAG: MoaD/ThiS family protein [Thermoplasmata archaeon]